MSNAMNAYEKASKTTNLLGSAFQFFNKGNGLIALNEIIDNDDIKSEINLGYKEIDTERIVGTKNKSRTYGFSKDFMPVLDVKSEFGAKWIRLYDSIVEKGTIEPIKVYEYLHNYYVEEGNKRVSVNKFLGSPLMPAYVTRIVPKLDEKNEKIFVYYEFMEFYDKIAIDFIELSCRGSYKRLYKIINDMNFEDGEEINEIRYMYNAFKKPYLKNGGNKLSITVGDAFLKYLELYADFSINISKNIRNMWAEFTLKEDEKLEFENDEDDVKTFNIPLSKYSFSKDKLKIAFVYDKNPETSNWTYYHDEARKKLEGKFGEKLKIDTYFDIDKCDSAYESLEDIASFNYDAIFTTSTTLMNDTIKASLKYKNTKFLNASENFSSKSVRTYFGRMYEANYLLGVLSGQMTESNRVGVLVSYPIPEVIRAINAFTLGARFVNKDTNVFVKWMSKESPDKEDVLDIDKQFVELGCDLVWNNMACDMKLNDELFGLYRVSDEDVTKMTYLASNYWNWEPLYEEIIKSLFDGSYSFIANSWGINNKVVSYIWDMRLGLVDIDINKDYLPFELEKTINKLKKLINKEVFDIFEGPLRDRFSNEILADGQVISKQDILGMDYFVEGVIGSIPSIHISDDGEKLLDILGVKKKY